jgi:serine/threonine protein kinase
MAQKLLHYDVLERLGQGAGSVIYRVLDPTTGQYYALKHVVRNEPKDIRFVEQMEAEFALSRQFVHPNLRRSYDLKINRTMLVKVTEAFLLMELVDGRPLDEQPPTDLVQTVDIFIKAAQGLQAMHSMGYVHCDIKPNNILVGNGLVKVIDFGQSCQIGTVKERIQGTPDYIAPEQVKRKPVSHKTDIYNLGATLYWATTGRNSPTLYTVQQSSSHSFLVDTEIPTPRQLNPNVPLALSNLIMECIANRPEKRPAGMDQVIQRLELSRLVLLKQMAPPDQPVMEQLSEEELKELDENR